MGIFDWLFGTEKDNGAKRKDRGIFIADEDADFECDQCGEYFEDCECDDCGDEDLKIIRVILQLLEHNALNG